ncbi:hypothetical protein NLJ89_g4482 [Agrocybe chaxingu]|uniref:Uncharacterized protein n=1 Tax=Agrocybe chaxingu TaxID=84603 RepID=A0A9W8MXZ6_9AGAR|nr:hypothetical protein NLJ89_g4482 [Agrocybe chaxingu]
MPPTQTASPESSSDSLPPGSYNNNSDVRNSLNTTKIVQTVNNYFGSSPGRPSTSHADRHQDFFPPSRSSLASITDVPEDEPMGTDAASSVDIGDQETSLADASALVKPRQGVRFSQDVHSRKQEERPKTYIAAYEYDMDAPDRTHASKKFGRNGRNNANQLFKLDPYPSNSEGETRNLIPIPLLIFGQNFDNSKTLPPKVRTYMRSDFFVNNWSIALYMPSPGVNHNPRRTRKNIAVGDVGVFTLEGGFEVFFNIFMTEEINKQYGYHPPPNFVPCATVMNDNIRKTYMKGRQYVQGDFRDRQLKEYVFSCETPCTRLRLKGSALVLPMGCWKFKFSLAMKTLIENYLNVHADDWYKHYRSTPMLPSGSLKIINATYKSTTWAYAVGMKGVTTLDKRLFANLSRPGQDEDIFDWEQHDDDVSVDAGPSAIEMDGPKATLINHFLAFAPMSKSPVAVLTPPSSTTSPEFSLDSPDVAEAKALVLKSQFPAVRQQKADLDEPQKTYTFTAEELQSLFMNLLNSQNTSADSDTEDTCVPEESESEPEEPRKKSSKRTSAKKKAGGCANGSFSGNTDNVHSFNRTGSSSESRSKWKSSGLTHSNNKRNQGSFNNTTTVDSLHGIPPFLYGMPFGIPGMPPMFPGDGWAYAQQGSTKQERHHRKYVRQPPLRKEKGPTIGDVGYIDNYGLFIYCFNIFYPADHPIQPSEAGCTPREFTPIQPPLSDWEVEVSPSHFPPGSVVTTDGIKVTDSTPKIEFSTCSRQGAVLVLPEGASREDLVDISSLFPYIKKHAPDWYQFLNGYADFAHSEPVVNASLLVVTGCDKAAVWAHAWLPPTTFNALREDLTFTYDESAEVCPIWLEENAVDGLHSTEERLTGSPSALFLRGIRVALGPASWKRIMPPYPLENRPHFRLPTRPITRELTIMEKLRDRYDDKSPPSKQLIFYPAMVTLPMMLAAVPSSEIAVFEDKVWSASVSGKYPTLDEVFRTCRTVLNNYNIVESDGVVYFRSKASCATKPDLPTTITTKAFHFFESLVDLLKFSLRKRKAMHKLYRILPSPKWTILPNYQKSEVKYNRRRPGAKTPAQNQR